MLLLSMKRPTDLPTNKKAAFIQKFISLFTKYKQILVIGINRVGSRQINEVRNSLRDKAVILGGKKSTIRHALKTILDASKIQTIKECIEGNTMLVFCISPPSDIIAILKVSQVPIPAREGMIAPANVYVQPGPTQMDPANTSMFQALGIATKIVKHQIEITTETQIVTEKMKVSTAAASLLRALNLTPFKGTFAIHKIYDDGHVYPASVFEVSDKEILEDYILQAVKNTTALALAVDIPTPYSIPHTIHKAFMNNIALVINTEFTFPRLESIKNAMNAAVMMVNTTTPQVEKVAAAIVEEKAEEEEDDDDEAFGFDLFG